VFTAVTSRMHLGDVRKVPHPGCSSSNALRIEYTPEGFTFYCFKCNEFWIDKKAVSVAERKRKEAIYRETKKKQAERSITLPADFSQNTHPKGLAWLGKAGWTSRIIQLYNVGWSDSLHRVILPIEYQGYKGYTARAVESWQQPKYLECIQNKHPWVSLTPGDTLVLTEDILSAGRVAEYLPAMALLGTTLNPISLSIIQLYNKIFIWLDPDNAGIKGAIGVRKRLGLTKEVQIVRSDKDPKLLSNKEIKEKLCSVMLK